MNTAYFILSLDYEFLWGNFDKGRHLYYKNRLKRQGLDEFTFSRDIIGRLLQLLERYEVSATWATVGFLLQEKNTPGAGGRRCPAYLRPRHAWYSRDWFSEVEGDSFREAPLWYAPDTIERILKCKTPQELASHSFAHIIFDDEGCTPEIAASDLQHVVEAHKKYCPPVSFIYPRNQVGHLDILVEYGFKVTRETPQLWYSRIKTAQIKKIAHVVDDVLGITPPTGLPHVDPKTGIVILPFSMFLQSRDGLRKWIPSGSRIIKAKRGIDRAIARKEIFHLSFHPINFFCEPEKMFDTLEEIFKYLNLKREKGLINVVPKRYFEQHVKVDLSIQTSNEWSS